MNASPEYIESSQVPDFVKWLRSVAPYIHLFKEKIFVIGFPGDLICAGKIESLIHDLALLNAMGIKIVIVYGSKPQIEEKIKLRNHKCNFVNGLRISDEIVMESVKEAVGQIRLNIETLFSSALPNTPMGNSRIKVISGNFLTAKPYGIHNGIDFYSTGLVRKVEKDQILLSLSQGAIVLIPPLGFSPTGEAFNLSFEDVASSVSLEICANKLIFFVADSSIPPEINKKSIEVSCENAKRIIKKAKLLEKGDLSLINAVKACENGVERTHLIPFNQDGAIFLELFTHSGIGVMVVEEKLESLREAKLDDLVSIVSLIEPFENDGTLKYRDRHLLEQEINMYAVIEHDGIICGCASLMPFNGDLSAELGCLIVHKKFQGHGVGEKLLFDAEKKAKKKGVVSMYVRTTSATHWFLKRGFDEVNLKKSNKINQSNVENNRGSKLLEKKLT